MRIKLIIASLILSSLISNPLMIVRGVSSESPNMEEISISKYNQIMGSLVRAINEHDTSWLTDTLDSNHVGIFTDECYDEMYQLILNNDFEWEDYLAVVDVTYPDNSTTNDTVIMVNVQAYYYDYSDFHDYNQLYLFEFHVNAEGGIYGFNVWAY